MSVHAEENGVRYVLSVSSHSTEHEDKEGNRLSVKKLTKFREIRVKKLPSSSTGYIIRPKYNIKLLAKQELSNKREECNTDSDEFAAIENRLVVETPSNVEDVDDEPLPKKQKSELSGQPSTKRVVLHCSTDTLKVPNIVGNYDDCSSSEDTECINLKHNRAKSASEDTFEKRPGRCKVFRDEWLNLDVFRDWLDRVPNNPYKARCIACNTIMNAGKSELEKHAVAARHERAVSAMHQSMLQQLATADAEAEVEEDGDLEEDFLNGRRQANAVCLDSVSKPILIQPTIDSEVCVTIQEQQLEAINRVASAIETLSSNVCALVEHVSTQQQELISVLSALQKKVSPEESTK